MTTRLTPVQVRALSAVSNGNRLQWSRVELAWFALRRGEPVFFRSTTIDALERRGMMRIVGKQRPKVQITRDGRTAIERHPETCIGCGCQHLRPCDVGCWWVDHCYCSACEAGVHKEAA